MKTVLTYVICFIIILTANCTKNQETDSFQNYLDQIQNGIDMDLTNDIPMLVRNPPDSSLAKNTVNNKQPRNRKKSTAPKRKVDIDLTKLSTLMIFAQVQKMMTTPEDFMGKTVRMSGPYAVWCFANTDECHHFITIADATACCQSGFEFYLKDAAPEDYPPEMSFIEIEGVFSSYEKFNLKNYRIEIDSIIVLEN